MWRNLDFDNKRQIPYQVSNYTKLKVGCVKRKNQLDATYFII